MDDHDDDEVWLLVFYYWTYNYWLFAENDDYDYFDYYYDYFEDKNDRPRDDGTLRSV